MPREHKIIWHDVIELKLPDGAGVCQFVNGDDINKIPEKSGVYIFAAQPKDALIYIGETGSLKTRINQHLEGGSKMVQITTTFEKFKKQYGGKLYLTVGETAHHKFVENALFHKIAVDKIDTARLVNKRLGASSINKIVFENHFYLAARFFGDKIHMPKVAPEETKPVKQSKSPTKTGAPLFLSAKWGNASGYETEDGQFVINKGSIMRDPPTGAFGKAVGSDKPTRNEILNSGAVEKRGKHYAFIRDYVIYSKRAACRILSGSPASSEFQPKGSQGNLDE